MTVSSTTSRVVYSGNGSTTVFPFAFKVQSAADLVVVYSDATGTDVTLTPSQYAATGFGQDAGGTVSYAPNGAPIATGTKLTIYRNVSPTQPTSISNQGAMWPAVIEAALDRLTFIVQYFLDGLSRALTISPTDGGALDPLPNAQNRAGMWLAFDPVTAQPVAAQAVDLAGVASWLANNFLLAATSAANACAAIGAAFLTGNNAFTGNNTFSGSLMAPQAIGGSVLRSHLAGLTLSNDGTSPNTKLDVAAGACAADGNTTMLVLAAGAIDCTTTGANGLDTGSLANSAWYHAFAIGQAGGASPALLASTSLTPTMPTGYTLKRRLGSFRTDGSAHILAFVQDGDLFQWASRVNDINSANPGTSAVTVTLTVPTGVHVLANVQFGIVSTSGGGVAQGALTDLAITDTTPVSPGFSDLPGAASVAAAEANSFVPKTVRTNTAAQVRSRISFSDANVSVVINTLGWIDRRGRDA